jgi:hypothetical protein
MWRFGRHLGTSVSALVDGQLDPEAAEEAWEHVLHCPPCRRLVEREGWVKRQLAQFACQPRSVERTPDPVLGGRLSAEAMQAWADVDELEERGRGRRRAGIALVGAGSVSVAVLGLSTLSGAPLGIGGAPSGPPTSALSRGAASALPGRAVVAPRTHVRGNLPGWTVAHRGAGTVYAVPVGDRH